MSASLLFACNSLKPNQGDGEAGNPAAKIAFDPAPNQESAELFIYRPGRFGSGGATPEIYINQQHTLSLRNQSWHGFSVGPGDYLIETRHGPDWIAGETSQLALSVQKGNRYFIRVLAGTTFDGGNFLSSLLLPGSALFVGSKFPLIVVDQEKALEELWEMNVTNLSIKRPLEQKVR